MTLKRFFWWETAAVATSFSPRWGTVWVPCRDTNDESVSPAFRQYTFFVGLAFPGGNGVCCFPFALPGSRWGSPPGCFSPPPAFLTRSAVTLQEFFSLRRTLLRCDRPSISICPSFFEEGRLSFLFGWLVLHGYRVYSFLIFLPYPRSPGLATAFFFLPRVSFGYQHPSRLLYPPLRPNQVSSSRTAPRSPYLPGFFRRTFD